MNVSLLITLLIVGMISLVLLVGIFFFFGKLIWHQVKIWMLRNKGYIQVRHIREDMTENYYFIRVKDDHYDLDGGIYIDQKDVKTKTEDILPKFDYKLLSKKKPEEMTELEKQLKGFFDAIKEQQLMDIKTLPWGIPTISYFGNNPSPINYREIKKVYDAKNIAALIKRILLTKEWKLVRMVLILCSIAIIGLMVLSIVDYGLINRSTQNLAACQMMLNDTNNKLFVMFNNTLPQLLQNSTRIV